MGKIICLLVSLLLLPNLALAESAAGIKFECGIKSVLRVNEVGQIVQHGWFANYINRKFIMDEASGKVLSTTALKVRLSNYDAKNQPVVIKQNSYRAITIFKDKDTYAAIEIEKTADGKDMPFFYRTNIGMMLTGTCEQI